MRRSVQLCDETPISLGPSAHLGYYRLRAIRQPSPNEIRVSAKSRSAQAFVFVRWRICQMRRVHQIADSEAMVGNKLPTLRAAANL